MVGDENQQLSRAVWTAEVGSVDDGWLRTHNRSLAFTDCQLQGVQLGKGGLRSRAWVSAPFGTLGTPHVKFWLSGSHYPRTHSLTQDATGCWQSSQAAPTAQIHLANVPIA